MYTEIRRCLAIDYLDEFGPKSPTEHESEEYQDHKKRLDKEQALIKQGYDRIKEKVRNRMSDRISERNAF